MRQFDPPLILAADWLLNFLQPSPQPALAVFAAGHLLGFSRRTLQRAKLLLGVASLKAGFGGLWLWVHPDHRYRFEPNRSDLREFARQRPVWQPSPPKSANLPPKERAANPYTPIDSQRAPK